VSLPRKTDRQMPVGLDARESYIFGKRMASGEWTNISTIRCFREQRIAEANALTAADLPKRPNSGPAGPSSGGTSLTGQLTLPHLNDASPGLHS